MSIGLAGMSQSCSYAVYRITSRNVTAVATKLSVALANRKSNASPNFNDTPVAI